MEFKNCVQLITYPDSLGGDLGALNRILARDLPGVFGGLHILPPYPSTGDRGFAPTTYYEIDARFGGWGDIAQLSQRHDVLLDFMVNHISRHSDYFKDFVKHGRASRYADLFITLEKVWPDGVPNPADVVAIFLRRPKTPFLDVQFEDGTSEAIWATFGSADWSEQIDIDVTSPAGRQFITDILRFLAGQGVNALRLDAAAFVIKKAGTSCFLVEPEISAFFEWIHAQARAADITLLLEIHTLPELQAGLAARGYWVYNFVLPLLVLHAIETGTSATLKAHLESAPRKQITNLDVHDGIPVLPDIEGVLPIREAQRIVSLCEARGANVSRIFSPQHQAEGGFDAHQINCTYYSALDKDDAAYLLARAIQFFAPGIPQLYYVGLLAGENTPEEIEKQGDRRAINRYNYSEDEVRRELIKPVVQRQLELIRFRNTHPAFSGDFTVLDSSNSSLVLRRSLGEQHCTLSVDLAATRFSIEYSDESGKVQMLSL